MPRFSKLFVAAAAAFAAVANADNSGEHHWVEPTDPMAWPTIVTHSSGRIKLGVNDGGNLNVGVAASVPSVDGETVTGMRFVDIDNTLGSGINAEFESTSPGCLCEGWGAAFSQNGGALQSGDANQDDGGLNNIVVASMLMGDSQQVTSHTTVAGCLDVTLKYTPSDLSDFAYKVDMTFENTCADDITELRWRRVMDWDIEPTAFSERVYLEPGTASDLTCLHDNGFCRADPTISCGGITVGCVASGSETDAGVADHGAGFFFQFSDITAATPLAQGETRSVRTYYGAANTYAQAISEMSKLGDVEAYSIGVPSFADRDSGGPAHFFAFGGVGGDVIIPPEDDATVPCDCPATTVSTEGSSVTLSFSEDGPFTDSCTA